MQAIPTSMEGLRSLKSQRRATCWKITRSDGTIYRYTDHNSDLKVLETVADLYTAGDPYKTFKSIGGLSASARERAGNLEGGNLEASGAITLTDIKEVDLESGLFDNVAVIEYIVDWLYPHAGPFFFIEYEGSELSHTAEIWTGQLEGFPRILRTPAGDVYTKEGRVKAVPLSSDTAEITSSVTQRRIFKTLIGSLDTTADAYDDGVVVWTSGANDKTKSIVKKVTDPGGGELQFELQLETAHDFAVGDDCTIAKVEREEGFPFLPGTAGVLSVIPIKRG